MSAHVSIPEHTLNAEFKGALSWIMLKEISSGYVAKIDPIVSFLKAPSCCYFILQDFDKLIVSYLQNLQGPKRPIRKVNI